MLGVDVLSDAVDASRPLFAETDIRLGRLALGTPRRTMLRGTRKVVTRPGSLRDRMTGSGSHRERVCFDLERDPLEQKPIAPGAPGGGCPEAGFRELEAWERAMRQRADRLGKTESFELSPREARSLRELGYGE